MQPGTPTGTDGVVRYFFVVTRKSPEILARVQERLHGDPRIEVIADRRFGERRQAAASAHVPERRRAERRRPTSVWNDLTMYPTLVAQRHVDSYAELEAKLASASGDNDRLRDTLADLQRLVDKLITEDEQLRADNTRLRDEVAELHRQLTSLASADAAFRAEVGALLGQAEQTLGSLIATFQRLTSAAPPPPPAPRPRGL